VPSEGDSATLQKEAPHSDPLRSVALSDLGEEKPACERKPQLTLVGK
jgi:hypothetical protein